MKKQTIAVDIDDVIAQWAESFADFCNQRWGTNIGPEDWTEHWSELWGVEHEETIKRAQQIYASDLFKQINKNDEAEAALRQLAKRYHLVVLTSRNRAVSKDTLDWIAEHFGDLFEEIHFAGIWDNLDKKMMDKLKLTKAEICQQIGANYLIDDQPKHCIAAAGAGIEALLFGDYKWNRDIKLKPRMTRVKTWQEVLEYFDARG